MTSTSLRRTVLLFLLAVLLTVPWSAAAAPRRTAQPRAEAPSLALPDLAGRFWAVLRSVWGKAGLNIDPDGLSAPVPQPGPAGSADEGLNIDPDGLSAPVLNPGPADSADEGANIDPDGGPRH